MNRDRSLTNMQNREQRMEDQLLWTTPSWSAENLVNLNLSDTDMQDTLSPYYYTGLPNIFLSATAITLNIFVIRYYSRQGKLTLVPLLYTLIAFLDILLSIGITYQSIAMGLFSEGEISMSALDNNAVAFYTLFQISNRTSIFCNLLLAVYRTVMILRPFHHINLKVVKVACLLYVVPWIVLSGIAINQFLVLQNPYSFVISLYINDCYLGSGLAYMVEEYSQNMNLDIWFAVAITPDLISFVIPVIIVAVSCTIQVISINRSNQFPTSSNQRHVTITVILMSCLFVVCNSAFSIYILYLSYLYWSHGEERLAELSEHFPVVVAILGAVFPVLNAALNPVIIISRSKELRGSFIGTVRRMSSRTNRGTAEVNGNRT